MNPKHEAKIDKLIESLVVELKNSCEGFYRSGGINIEDYNPESFLLAEVLVSAAMDQCKNLYFPIPESCIKDLKNLLHF